MDHGPLHLKYIEILQATISRMAQNSFTIRGWSVSLVAIVLAIAAAKDAPGEAALVLLAPVLIFWGLDAYYLRQERLFRKLFATAVGAVDPGQPPTFEMDTSAHGTAVDSWWKTLVSGTVLPIPLALATVIALVAALVH